MMTLFEIEQRAETLRARMEDLVKEIKTTRGNSKRAKAILEEMVSLSSEHNILNYNLEHYRQMAEQLLTSPCSGPH